MVARARNPKTPAGLKGTNRLFSAITDTMKHVLHRPIRASLCRSYIISENHQENEDHKRPRVYRLTSSTTNINISDQFTAPLGTSMSIYGVCRMCSVGFCFSRHECMISSFNISDNVVSHIIIPPIIIIFATRPLAQPRAVGHKYEHICVGWPWAPSDPAQHVTYTPIFCTILATRYRHSYNNPNHPHLCNQAVYNSRRPMFAWAGPLAPTYPGGIPGGGDLIRIKPESGVITGRGQYAPNPGQPQYSHSVQSLGPPSSTPIHSVQPGPL
eukprot:1175509-Prorocentrum_minimum.AAC.1